MSKLQDRDKLKQQVNYSRHNLKLFKAYVHYFYRLRNENRINDEVLYSLIRYSCAVFIENQLEKTLHSVLEKSLVKFWNSQLTNVEDSFENIDYFAESSEIIKSLQEKTAYV